MRALVVQCPALETIHPRGSYQAIVPIAGQSVHFAIREIDDTEFDASSSINRNMVFVRIRGFSLNYRDKVIILSVIGGGSHQVIGSEFVGEVVAVGRDVQHLRVGQRVMAEMAWPSNGTPGAVGGVPTNAASAEFQLFHQSKIVPIPNNMPEEVAAAFALGAQTAYSMVRRLKLEPGENVLVTAATSNTSLFAIHALRSCGVNIYAVTSTPDAAESLRSLGVEQVIYLTASDFLDVARVARAIGGFDAVIDPFSDVYIPKLIGVMGFFARYVTCGVAEQGYTGISPTGSYVVNLSELMPELIIKNIHLIGNCLGLKQDLEAALEDWANGRFDVTIDSVYTGVEVETFINRTYNAKDRFGKVVYLYS